jgi:hypothetical protein
MDVSGGVLATWMPAIHAGMTKICIFMFWGERKIMNHFVLNTLRHLTQQPSDYLPIPKIS